MNAELMRILNQCEWESRAGDTDPGGSQFAVQAHDVSDLFTLRGLSQGSLLKIGIVLGAISWVFVANSQSKHMM